MTTRICLATAIVLALSTPPSVVDMDARIASRVEHPRHAKMPDVIGWECKAAMEEIKKVADPDPDFEHYDYDNGNAKLTYIEATHGKWLVKETDPKAGQDIVSIVKLYIRDPGGGGAVIIAIAVAALLLAFLWWWRKRRLQAGPQ